MSLAFVFPGQGSQSVGMQADIAAAHPIVEQTYAEANEILQQGRIYHPETVNRALGAATSFRQLLQEVRKSPALSERRIWLEAMGRILGRGRNVVFEPDEDGTRFQLYLQE